MALHNDNYSKEATLTDLFKSNQINNDYKFQNSEGNLNKTFNPINDKCFKNNQFLTNEINLNQNNVFSSSNSKNQDNLLNIEEDLIDSDLNNKKKFNKGLKLLSVIVRDIVVEKQSTTYKEVADIILKDTIKFENLNIHSEIEIAKEEQNIKRRVYDALNVLISADVLKKNGKYVLSSH